MLYDTVWEPGRPLAAACASGHPAPDAGCACGIYAARRPEEALRYLVGRDEPSVVARMLGRVALWGTVVEAKDGWRGEWAYPFELESERAARRYGVSACPPIRRSRSSASRLPSATARS